MNLCSAHGLPLGHHGNKDARLGKPSITKLEICLVRNHREQPMTLTFHFVTFCPLECHKPEEDGMNKSTTGWYFSYSERDSSLSSVRLHTTPRGKTQSQIYTQQTPFFHLACHRSCSASLIIQHTIFCGLMGLEGRVREKPGCSSSSSRKEGGLPYAPSGSPLHRACHLRSRNCKQDTGCGCPSLLLEGRGKN